MENHGFVRVAAAIPELKVADCIFNANRIKDLIFNADAQNVQILCFPELCITGYTCGDLFHQELLLKEAGNALEHLVKETANLNVISIVGLPIRSSDNKLYNTSVVFSQGVILGFVPKTHLPNYSEFYEQRWFRSAFENTHNEIVFHNNKYPFGTDLLFTNATLQFGIEICEDLWAPDPPSAKLALNGAHIIFNLSASNELIGKNNYLKSLIKQQSARCISGYVYASSGWGESTTDIVFGGNALIYENGECLNQSKRFLFEEQLIISEIDIERLKIDRGKNTTFFLNRDISRHYYEVSVPEFSTQNFKLTRKINPYPFIPSDNLYYEHCNEVFSIQIGGLAKRLMHTGLKDVIVGISGGLDSTLALLVCVKTYDKLGLSRKNITGVTMPGFGTTDRTYNNALQLMQSLQITIREINIEDACMQHFKDIGHDPSMHDVTYENTQARERTQILMDIANQLNGLVIGTGDLSELALGWATYNGDHMSMYAVNTGIPKTMVKYLVQWIAEAYIDEESCKILKDILNTPVSPELLPPDVHGKIIQKTEDIVGPYELHDFYLYYTVRFGFSPEKIYFLAQYAFEGVYSDEEILRWIEVFFKRFFNNQFKRSCLPDGPKVGSINLSPRGDWRMPSDANVNIWIRQIEMLKDKNK